MAELSIDILTPSKLAYSAEVKAVTIPGTAGSFQVLQNHAPLLSTFEVGAIKIIVDENNTKYFSTSGGSVEVLSNKIKVLADSLEAINEIDVDRAKNAQKRAEDRLANRLVDKIDVTRAEAALARAINRLKLYEKYSNS